MTEHETLTVRMTLSTCINVAGSLVKNTVDYEEKRDYDFGHKYKCMKDTSPFTLQMYKHTATDQNSMRNEACNDGPTTNNVTTISYKRTIDHNRQKLECSTAVYDASRG
jgi:hypothetical protein